MRDEKSSGMPKSLGTQVGNRDGLLALKDSTLSNTAYKWNREAETEILVKASPGIQYREYMVGPTQMQAHFK